MELVFFSLFFFFFNKGGIVKREAANDRLSYASSLLLACVAFLYISNDSIPRLPYLTTLDKMILYGFLNLFLVMLETFIVFRISARNDSMALVLALDTHSAWFLPLLYIGNQLQAIYAAFQNRRQCYESALEGNTGVEPVLLQTTQEEMSKRRWWHQKDVELFEDVDVNRRLDVSSLDL